MGDNKFEEIVGLKELKLSDLRTDAFGKLVEYFKQYPIVELDDSDASNLAYLLYNIKFDFNNWRNVEEAIRLINVLIKKRYNKD